MKAARPVGPRVVSANLYSGDEGLEVVGENNYQAHLWEICGGVLGDRIRHEVVAALVPEPENEYDANAISVQVDGRTVGYLARAEAIEYGPGLLGLMRDTGAHVALKGVIVGGGQYDDGPGRLA